MALKKKKVYLMFFAVETEEQMEAETNQRPPQTVLKKRAKNV